MGSFSLCRAGFIIPSYLHVVLVLSADCQCLLRVIVNVYLDSGTGAQPRMSQLTTLAGWLLSVFSRLGCSSAEDPHALSFLDEGNVAALAAHR